MRLWSIHPKYLDSKGLVALWRETLLAQKVLQGKTKGYRNHPQLTRFKNLQQPVSAIGTYLHQIYLEAERRGYHFNSRKIIAQNPRQKIKVTDGQLAFEWAHFKAKAKKRDRQVYNRLSREKSISPHPIFRLVSGTKADWEKG